MSKDSSKTADSNNSTQTRDPMEPLRHFGLLFEHERLETGLTHRISHRRQRQAAIRHRNLEQVVDGAREFVNDNRTTAHVDPDWLCRFLEIAEDIHSSQMQQLWSRILAAEMGRPGTISTKSLELLRRLTQREANMFQRVCALAGRMGSGSGLLIVHGWQHATGWFNLFGGHNSHDLSLSRFGLPYSTLLSLADIGFLFTEELSTSLLREQDEISISFPAQSLTLKPRRNHTSISYYRFTGVGEELAQLISADTNEAYLAELRANLETGFVID